MPCLPHPRVSFRLALGVCALTCIAQAHAQCISDLQTFEYTGAIETYTVPTTGTFWLQAAGAEGGNHAGSHVPPGRGAIVGGSFALTAGDQLRILVGQQPSLTHGEGNGGGGGSFVVSDTFATLLIAGGGAGSGDADNVAKHGQTGPDGGDGTMESTGGTGEMGGSSSGPSSFYSGAGAGLLGDGANGWSLLTGGVAFVNGGAGAAQDKPGGFGGGGSGSGYIVGGGGGGYSGGAAGGLIDGGGGMGGGGGSYNASASPDTPLTGEIDGNTGHGRVQICRMEAAPVDPPVPVPTLNAWMLSLLSLAAAAMGWTARRRKLNN